MTEYLTTADLIALHGAIMERTGYAPAPLRDEGLLESAAMRPRMAAHYEDADLIAQAVLLAVGISQNQPFLDGNKRTAYAALDVFLRINGLRFGGDPIALARQFELLAESANREEASTSLTEWLREQVHDRDAT